MSVLLAVAMLATSAVWPSAAAKGKGHVPMWKSKTVNETVTAEVTLEYLVKNYDDSGDLHGTLKIGLFGNKVPMTVLNFMTLCNGVKRPTGELKLSGSFCHRVITDMHVQCGDITTGDGNGGISIYGDTFNDENFDIGHSEKGTISMSNKGPNSNGSQFFIIYRSMQQLDGQHVAFGQIVDKKSLEFLDKLNETPTDTHTFSPKHKVKIVDCTGETLKKPLVINRRANVKDDTFE